MQDQEALDLYLAEEKDPKKREAAKAMFYRRALAIEDPAEFFSLAMREETTRVRVNCLPHQRVFFDFVMAHSRSVVRLPVGASKTFSAASLTVWLLGRDPTTRGAVVSSSLAQAQKPLALVRDLIADPTGEFNRVRFVFPNLQPTKRDEDPWTQSKLTVDRPAGIRDPSVVAVGVDGRLPGSRLNWILVDDILDRQNTSTPEGRQKVKTWFESTVLSRRDARGSRIVVTNTPWHPEDLTYALEKAGWPTLTMDIEGNILITNTDWDTHEIRPAHMREGDYCRLKAHDSKKYGAPLTIRYIDGKRVLAEQANGSQKLGAKEYFDIEENIPLWPERFDRQIIDGIKVDYAASMHQFNQLYLCCCRDDESARCKIEWIDQCKENAIKAGITSLVSKYTGGNLTVTGVDLAMGVGKQHDLTCFFTFEVIPSIQIDGKTLRDARRILDIEAGRWDGKTIVQKLVKKSRDYNSIVRVETNAAQTFLKQWANDTDTSIPIRAHVTGENKHHRAHGVESLFLELANGAWIIPCEASRRCHPQVQAWVDDCMYYQPPPAHTSDRIMAMWLAREEARYVGGSSAEAQSGALGMGLLAR